MTDKELFYQVLNREVTNIISAYLPQFKMFSGTISNYIFKFIDPYIDAFLQGDKLNTDAIEKYTNQEVSDKIKSFMEKYNTERSNEAKL